MDVAVGPIDPVVRAHSIDFAYGQGDSRNQVLFDISIEIPPGQLVVMTGPSGSGKTTLLTLIGGLRSMQDGQIEILGHDLSRLSPRDLVRTRREIGFIFQMHNLFEALTATENVKMALQLGGLSAAEMHQRACAMLEELGLGERLGYKPRSLSGGQRQRVAIARALANLPRLILADEPTAALDKDATLNVISRLQADGRGKRHGHPDGDARPPHHRIGRPARAHGRRAHRLRCRAQRCAAHLRIPQRHRAVQAPVAGGADQHRRKGHRAVISTPATWSFGKASKGRSCS